MTTADLDAATRAAFAHRYRDRIGHRFDLQPGPVQCRWLYVCAQVLNGVITNGQAFRAMYLQGFAGTEALKSWTQISQRDRWDWEAVYLAASRHGVTTERRAA